jgi:hypothetical protein
MIHDILLVLKALNGYPFIDWMRLGTPHDYVVNPESRIIINSRGKKIVRVGCT